MSIGPVIGDARELPPDTPFRIAVIGDFSGRTFRNACETGDALAHRKPIEIDRDNFDQVMQRLGVKLEGLLVADDQDPVSLRFRELEDFEPDQLYDKVELFASLRALRRRLSRDESFAAAAQEVMHWQKEPAAADSSPDMATAPEIDPDHLLEQILGESLDSGDASNTAGGIDWKQMIAELVAPYTQSVPDTSRQKELIGCVDQAAQATMVALLHHPAFQHLEAAWRALRLLVFNLETDSKLKVFLIDVSRQEIESDLHQAEELNTSGIHRLLAGSGAPNEPQWAVIAGNYRFGATNADAELLGKLGRSAASLQTTFVAAGQADLVGCPPKSKSDPRQWKPSENETWQALRQSPEAHWLGLVWPRFLLRLPYGPKWRPTDALEFTEVRGDPATARLLFGNGSFLCALLLGKGFSQHGWKAQAGDVSDFSPLPLMVYEDEDGDSQIRPCGERLLNDDACEQVMGANLMPLVSHSGRDLVKIQRFSSLSGQRLRI